VSHHKAVIVEGLIGGGKTSLSRELAEALGSTTLVLYEPDEKGGKNPYLADYYDDPKRWGFTLQVHQLQARYRMHLQAQWHVMQGAGHAVLDRSYFGDTAFARLQHQLGWVSDREFETYSSIYHAMTAQVLLPNVCVRILVSPETCNRRIAKRMRIEEGRKCEKAIDIDYLKALDREIDHMVGVLRAQGVAILDVPWDEDRESAEDRKEAIAGLAARIESIEPANFFLDRHRRTI
jgi:deoxyadenosine/deoxycytidine kinase